MCGILRRKRGLAALKGSAELLRDPQVEMISITAPNRLHAQITIDAARAGKHVVCEKPMCLTLEEADAMIDACRKAGVLLLYAEELFFAPKYVKAKQLADEGAFGRVHLVKQGEKHSGPHSEWFWDVEQSGGGAVMDLGCHGIAFCWWFLGKPSIKSVYAQMATQVHAERTQGEDEAVTLIEFENGAVGMVESSWNRPGGMDDSIERCSATKGRPTPICSWGTRSRRIQRWASATPSKRRPAPRAGPIPCSRSTGTTASPRRCGTSRAACAVRRRRSPTGKPDAWCRRLSAPRTRRPDWGERSRCRSARRASPSRSTFGRRREALHARPDRLHRSRIPSLQDARRRRDQPARRLPARAGRGHRQLDRHHRLAPGRQPEVPLHRLPYFRR